MIENSENGYRKLLSVRCRTDENTGGKIFWNKMYDTSDYAKTNVEFDRMCQRKKSRPLPETSGIERIQKDCIGYGE